MDIPRPSPSNRGGQKHPKDLQLLVLLAQRLNLSKPALLIPTWTPGDLGIVQENVPGQILPTNLGMASALTLRTTQLIPPKVNTVDKVKKRAKTKDKEKAKANPILTAILKQDIIPKEELPAKAKEKAKGKTKPKMTSPNRMPLGQRTPSSSRGPDDRDTQVAEAEEYNYWSQAIQKAREDTSRIPVLAEISPSEADPPRAVDQDEVQAVNHLILTKDTEVPENISHHMAEILLTKIPAEDLSGDNFSYLEMTDEGIG